jgi:hypothetical protein
MSDIINNMIKVKVPSLNKTIDYSNSFSKIFNPIDAIKTMKHTKDDPFYLMKVLPSTIKDAGLGTFATQFIPVNTNLGKYYGDVTTNPPVNTDYAWTIFDTDKIGKQMKKYVDGINYKENNPLRYVNAPKNQQEKSIINTSMFQREGNVHYKTTRNINKGEELFIDYGDNYWTSRKNRNAQKGGSYNYGSYHFLKGSAMGSYL